MLVVTPAWIEACTDGKLRVPEKPFLLAAAVAPTKVTRSAAPAVVHADASAPAANLVGPSQPDGLSARPLADVRLWVDAAFRRQTPPDDLAMHLDGLRALGATVVAARDDKCTHVAAASQIGDAYAWVRSVKNDGRLPFGSPAAD